MQSDPKQSTEGTFESSHEPELGFPKDNLDGEGGPPYISDGVSHSLARSSVMRFSQTQNFFRSKKLVLFAKILFGGFPRGILKDPRGFVPTPCPKSWYSISAFSTLREAILLLLDFFESAWIVLFHPFVLGVFSTWISPSHRSLCERIPSFQADLRNQIWSNLDHNFSIHALVSDWYLDCFGVQLTFPKGSKQYFLSLAFCGSFPRGYLHPSGHEEEEERKYRVNMFSINFNFDIILLVLPLFVMRGG